ncbi:MAG: hypothetical protein AAFO04_25425 [Cyanobacteria bacterium J06592_8]
MLFKYFLQEFKFDDFLRVSILRKTRLFDEQGNEIQLADSISNYRCTLNPSTDIEKELEKLTADGTKLDDELIYFINTKLTPMLEIAWTEDVVKNFEESTERDMLL